MDPKTQPSTDDAIASASPNSPNAQNITQPVQSPSAVIEPTVIAPSSSPDNATTPPTSDIAGAPNASQQPTIDGIRPQATQPSPELNGTAAPKPFMMEQSAPETTASVMPSSPPASPAASVNSTPQSSPQIAQPQQGIPEQGLQQAPVVDNTTTQSFASPGSSPAPGAGGTPPPPPPQSNGSALPSQPPKPPNNPLAGFKSKRPLFIGISAAIVVAIAGFVFGYYIPNLPENVYKTGLDRTGDVIHGLITEATEAEQIDELSRMELTATFSMVSEDAEVDGVINAKTDDKLTDSTFTVDFSEGGNDKKSLSGGLKSNLTEGERFPDIYFRLKGYSSLGLDAFMPGINRYDNKWIAISSSYLEENFGTYLDEVEEEEATDLTEEDYAQLIRDISQVTNDYVLTSDEDKAVLKMEEFVGQEESDGLKTNRYIVSIDKENLITYCQELADVVYQSEVYRKYNESNKDKFEAELKKAREDCQENIEEDLDDDYTLDLWVDRRTKLIHKVRLYDQDSDNKESYVEFGQRYEGGDELDMFANIHDQEEESDMAFTLSTNLENNVSSGELVIDQRGPNGYEATVELTVKPYDEDIQADPPAGALPIEKLIEELYGGSVLGTQTEETETTDNNDVEEPVFEEPVAPEEPTRFQSSLERLFR